MRVDVRLSAELARKLEVLEQVIGRSASEVMRAALERYYEVVCARKTTSREAILASGLVGCGEAEPGLSEGYRDALSEGLEAKTDPR